MWRGLLPVTGQAKLDAMTHQPPDSLITSTANPLVKRVRRLATDRRFRQREGVFVVEGGQPVWRVMDAAHSGRRFGIEQLVVCDELVRPEVARAMVRDFEDAGGRVARVTPEVFVRMSDRDGPAGVLALVHADHGTLGELAVGDDDTFIALENVGNPGNLGTIVRTADAAGASGVVLIGHGADPFDPAAVKASMGSMFSVPVVRAESLEQFLVWTRATGVQVVATSGGASDTHWGAHYRTPTVLLFGAEGPGLSDAALAGAETTVRIPMVGTAESLNLSIAVAVLLYEVRRPRLEA